jgi:hypothetical protein
MKIDFTPANTFRGTQILRQKDNLAYAYETSYKAVDADGAPNAYHPKDIGLDYLKNAGYPNTSWWRSVIVPDKNEPSQAYVQPNGQFKGYFIAMTALRAEGKSKYETATYVDATKVPYVVIPTGFEKLPYAAEQGDVGLATHIDSGKTTAFIVADAGGGGDAKLGEASIYLFSALGGNNPNPRNGKGVPKGKIQYILFPNSRPKKAEDRWPRTNEDIHEQVMKLVSKTPGIIPAAAPTPAAVAVAPAPPATVGPQPPITAASQPAKPSIVAVAKAEFGRYHGINEGSQPLRSRIADYYEAAGGSRGLDPTLNENAWSAAFVSFCVKQSGATSDQFVFSLSHSVYVHAAIANADANRGVFRGHRVTEYEPKLGDIIHHNRSGGTLNFDFARAHTGYPSHGVIVVDFEVQNGRRHAVTIGGNEYLAHGTGTVGKKFFPLDTSGLLDQSAIGPKLICVIENQLAAGAPMPTTAPGRYVVNVRTDLKLRGGPGPEFPIIKSLKNGTSLNVLEFADASDGRWALVDLEGDGMKDGYVFARYIEPVTS